MASDYSWEQRKFSEILDTAIATNTLSRAELNYERGQVLNIHYGDILIKYGATLNIAKECIPYVTNKIISDFNDCLLSDGDVVIADTAEDETVGKACEIVNSKGYSIVAGLHTMAYRSKRKFGTGYLGYYLNSIYFHQQLIPLMQGVKVLSISKSHIKKTIIFCPLTIAEQGRIAKCLIEIDNLITLHQCKQLLYAILRILILGNSVSWGNLLPCMQELDGRIYVHPSFWKMVNIFL